MDVKFKKKQFFEGSGGQIELVVVELGSVD